jgi:hypothetical protein
MSHPPFVDVKFYPGGSFPVGSGQTAFCSRYVGLTQDGEVYVMTLQADEGPLRWERI